ncbi:unnamed protein product [Adineta ricciae]|uniref:Major facilitator superfamily (MFS) profile domain-containing protein n=1 Tax=Adineta ricciae TaxID=249248 RepID=A0A814I0M2_ADIRI|nr:unnamed protein product [Adineta ricciae]
MAERKTFTNELILTALATGSGLISFGWNTGCLNNAQESIKNWIVQSYQYRSGHTLSHNVLTLLWSTTVAIFAIGGAIGAFTASSVSRRYGRRGGLLRANLFGIIAAICMSVAKFAHSPELLIIGRLVIGIECGLYTGLCTMYLSEVSPKRVRGMIGSLTGLSAYTGLMAAEIISTPIMLGTDSRWPLIMVIAGVPSVTQFILLQFCYESPRYLLMNRGDEQGARQALSALRKRFDIEDEINEMKQEAEHLRDEGHVSIRELFTQSVFRLPLAVAIVVHFSMRFCGINAIMYYSTALFKHANLGSVGPYATIGVGVILVLITLISGSLMDRAGRRTLHLFGLFGTWLCSLLLTITFVFTTYAPWLKFLSIAFVYMFVVFFAIGPGTVPWVVLPEIFAQGARPAATSVAVVTNWMSNFAVGLLFPLLAENNKVSDYSFIPFAVLTTLAFLFLYRYMPETKKRTFEEITMAFRPIEVSTRWQRFSFVLLRRTEIYLVFSNTFAEYHSYNDFKRILSAHACKHVICNLGVDKLQRFNSFNQFSCNFFNVFLYLRTGQQVSYVAPTTKHKLIFVGMLCFLPIGLLVRQNVQHGKILPAMMDITHNSTNIPSQNDYFVEQDEVNNLKIIPVSVTCQQISIEVQFDLNDLFMMDIDCLVDLQTDYLHQAHWFRKTISMVTFNSLQPATNYSVCVVCQNFYQSCKMIQTLNERSFPSCQAGTNLSSENKFSIGTVALIVVIIVVISVVSLTAIIVVVRKRHKVETDHRPTNSYQTPIEKKQQNANNRFLHHLLREVVAAPKKYSD